MPKICTIVGTRPELIKMSRVIAEFDRHTEHVLVHTGQNFDYELNQIFFEDLEIRSPDEYLNTAGETASETISKVIVEADRVLKREEPDAVLLYGDTNSCLAVIPAKRRRIPVFHMEAGNRCFDERVPEELNRRVVDHLSDVNLVLTEHARRYLLAEGIKGQKIFKTGSHMPEVLKYYWPKIQQSDATRRMGLQPGKFFLVSCHREENVDDRANLKSVLDTLVSLEREFGLPIVVSTHPRTRNRLAAMGFVPSETSVRFLKPFSFSDYVRLQSDAFCVLSDSGTISEEAALLDLAAVTIRNAHERPEGMDAGAFIMSGVEPSRVTHAVKVVTEQKGRAGHRPKRVMDYEGEVVSENILRIVLSNIDYVRQTVWYQ